LAKGKPCCACALIPARTIIKSNSKNLILMMINYVQKIKRQKTFL